MRIACEQKEFTLGGKYMKSRERLFSIQGVSPPSLSRRNCWSEWSQESTHHREIMTPPARGRRITAICQEFGFFLCWPDHWHLCWKINLLIAIQTSIWKQLHMLLFPTSDLISRRLSVLRTILYFDQIRVPACLHICPFYICQGKMSPRNWYDWQRASKMLCITVHCMKLYKTLWNYINYIKLYETIWNWYMPLVDGTITVQ